VYEKVSVLKERARGKEKHPPAPGGGGDACL